MMEISIVVASLLIAPYLMLAWLFGLTKVKQLYDKEWKSHKGLLENYEKLTPDQRMDLEIHREPTTPTQGQPKNNKDTQWLGSPTPQTEIREQNERVFEEGVVHTAPGVKFESHEEAMKAPDTTITNPEALKPKP